MCALEELGTCTYASPQYLDGLFERDPKAGAEYHERQVDLYAQYDPDKLLPFLRSCNDIPLQKVGVFRGWGLGWGFGGEEEMYHVTL